LGQPGRHTANAGCGDPQFRISAEALGITHAVCTEHALARVERVCPVNQASLSEWRSRLRSIRTGTQPALGHAGKVPTLVGVVGRGDTGLVCNTATAAVPDPRCNRGRARPAADGRSRRGTLVAHAAMRRPSRCRTAARSWVLDCTSGRQAGRKRLCSHFRSQGLSAPRCMHACTPPPTGGHRAQRWTSNPVQHSAAPHYGVVRTAYTSPCDWNPAGRGHDTSLTRAHGPGGMASAMRTDSAERGACDSCTGASEDAWGWMRMKRTFGCLRGKLPKEELHGVRRHGDRRVRRLPRRVAGHGTSDRQMWR
jgi:hypothetical protein